MDSENRVRVGVNGYMVENQAIVIPETIDALRALCNIEEDGSASIQRTDQALGGGSWRW